MTNSYRRRRRIGRKGIIPDNVAAFLNSLWANGYRNQNPADLDLKTTTGQTEHGKRYGLSPQALRRSCSIHHFDFATTEDLPHVREIIGQPRGVRAIEFGIDISSPGYNIFMLGPRGTGRATAVWQFLEQCAKEGQVPHDWVYVHNFKEPQKPRALMLPPGTGVRLRDAMAEMVVALRREIPLVLETKEFQQAVEEIDRNLNTLKEKFMGSVLAKAAEKEYAVVRTSAGLAVAPAADGKPIAPELLAQLPEEQRMLMEERRSALQRDLEEAIRAVHAAEKDAARAKSVLEADAVASLLDLHLSGARALCADNQKAQLWLDELSQDISDGLERFKNDPGQAKESVRAVPAFQSASGQAEPADSRFRRYQVNLIVDHSASAGMSVILEDLPTHKNLVGYIESEMLAVGAISADFTMIRPGALHLASGGYLVVNAMDILKQPYAWEALKRALSSHMVRIEDPESHNRAGVLFPQMPAPEPIPISVKVIMLGTPELYYSLQDSDDEFSELFKVKADFAQTMERSHDNEHRYALFVAARCHEGHLPHFDASGVAKIVEYGSWLAGHQGKLSTRFGYLSDLVHEAAHWAQREGKDLVSAADVQRAIEERSYRANLVEDEHRHRILEGTIFIDTEGEVVGQVNGLSVLSSGDHAFGQPSRLTARVYSGNEGVINIEREVKMAGPIHNKGLLTLRGYLGGQYALDHPLSLTASLTFEQNYGGVDGDSASSTELYALLSALSGYPIRQDIAVTGSVNQLGEVQPIGGATQKIEGFYDLCKERGLNGRQGVIIPTSSVKNLMLREEIVGAVEEDLFHIYAVNTIDQGIEILMGRAAGVRGPDGSYPAGSVHHAVAARLRELAETLQHYASCSRRR